jgi:uncharacterized protein YaaQ
MTLIVAIVQDYDCDRLLRAVSGAGLRATRIASTGGFLRMGNTTVFMGVPSERVSDCLAILEQTCSRRTQTPPPAMLESLGMLDASVIADVQIGGAVVFVKVISRFERFD